MGMNREAIGRTYEQAEPFVVTDEGARAYAAATNAADIGAYAAGGVAPPMYGVAYSFGALTAPLLDHALGADLMRLVHGEQDMRFLAPVRPGDVVTSTSRVHDIVEKATGELLQVEITSKNQRGEVVLSSTSGLFIRGPRRRENAAAEREERRRDEEAWSALPPLFSSVEQVAPDQSLRYAEASGDRNPIHVDDAVARLSGLPGVILHGACTMAFVHGALVRRLGGDPARVSRLSVRFARPVLPGDALSVDVRGEASGPWKVRVSNQAGIPVLKADPAEVRA